MLVALTINKLSKIHRKPSGDMSPFKNEYAKLDAHVCGGGMNAELRMTCRGRASILGPRQLTHKQTGFWPDGDALPLIRVRVLPFQCGCDDFHLCLRLGEGNSSGKTANSS